MPRLVRVLHYMYACFILVTSYRWPLGRTPARLDLISSLTESSAIHSSKDGKKPLTSGEELIETRMLPAADLPWKRRRHTLM